jgi:hypothetical protein
MRFKVIILALTLLIVAAPAIRADDLPAPPATPGAARPAYTTTGRLKRRHIESVLTDPRSAMTGAKQGTDWLLHSGREQRDTCDSPDATYGLRMLCVGW